MVNVWGFGAVTATARATVAYTAGYGCRSIRTQISYGVFYVFFTFFYYATRVLI